MLPKINDNKHSHKNWYTDVHKGIIHINSKEKTVDEWINKLFRVHTVDYCLAVKRHEVLMHATTWINLEDILSKRV